MAMNFEVYFLFTKGFIVNLWLMFVLYNALIKRKLCRMRSGIMPEKSAKVLLGASIAQRYKEFTLNTDATLSVPVLSSVPWIGVSKRRDVYHKEYSHSGPHHIKFITKNDEPHTFVWQTDAEKLKQGVRWGIVRTHSITGKVISALGQYRVVAHERAMKGMVSNSQAVKLKLLDLYQDRFEALHHLESLVNKNHIHLDYSSVLTQYITQLQTIEGRLNDYFAQVDCGGLNEQSISQIKADIQADRARAVAYLHSLEQTDDLRVYNRARGERSVLEFVKQQMVHGLYELQGINQDMTYSSKRYFALTRGELNDFIEDARKVIDDHEPDMRNAVTAKHHGIYSVLDHDLIAYDFSVDNLSSARQQQVLMAVSFIEGWDVLENKKDEESFVSNGIQKEYLEIYAATRWRAHRSILATIKSISFFILNIFVGIFISTRPWEEESWENPQFHLNAVKLRQHVPPIEPMWKKPLYFFIQIGYALKDMFNGIRDFGAKLIIQMPDDLVNDWQATQELSPLDETLAEITTAIKGIHQQEERRLAEILELCGKEFNLPSSQPTVKLAGVEYELSGGEFNDILNSMVRGLNGFSSVFTHNIYAKDPLAGLVFTTTYLIGIGMIYLPVYSTAIFGSSLVNSFNNISYAMASSSLGASIAGGSTLAQASVVIWDGLMHGSSGIAANTLYQFGTDPLTIAAYGVAAYALGYFLANGISGHQIPWLSNVLQYDLGTDPSTGYPIIGAKFAVMMYETLLTHPETHFEQPDLVKQESYSAERLSTEREHLLKRFKLVSWLSAHAKMLPEIEPQHKFSLARQLDEVFSKEERESLKKLLYLETHPSIAFQIFSIPLSYIPAIVHFLISPLISLAALLRGHPYPDEPVHKAGEFLFDKIKKDLSRLLVVATNITYLLYSLTAVLIKMACYLGIMALGRVAGLFDGKPAHAIHSLFASAHNLMRSIGEFFYPARAMKSVAVAHPTDTMLKTEASYVTLLQKMSEDGVTKGASVIGSKEEQQFSSPFLPRSLEQINTVPINPTGSFAGHITL